MQADSRIEEYYQVLGVNRATPLSQIRDAHKQLIRQWHPDRFDLNDPLREEAEQRAMDINNAYQQLKQLRTAGLGYRKIRAANQPTEKKRRNTVACKLVVRDGKLVSIKRKKRFRNDVEGRKVSKRSRADLGKKKIREVLYSARSVGQAVAKAAAEAAAKSQAKSNATKL